MSGDEISSTEAAKILGVSRQSLTTPTNDAVLRPRMLEISGVRMRVYSRDAVERLKAQRDAARGAPRVVTPEMSEKRRRAALSRWAHKHDSSSDDAASRSCSARDAVSPDDTSPQEEP